VTAPLNPDFARILSDLAEVGQRLSRTCEEGLALLRAGEAECRSPGNEPEAQMPTSPTALMTRREIAALLRIDARTLSRWRSDPNVGFPEPCHRARVLRWRRTAIERWLAAREP
jgi:predicted DNA-binding transcriptional regulator AlpA